MYMFVSCRRNFVLKHRTNISGRLHDIFVLIAKCLIIVISELFPRKDDCKYDFFYAIYNCKSNNYDGDSNMIIVIVITIIIVIIDITNAKIIIITVIIIFLSITSGTSFDKKGKI